MKVVSRIIFGLRFCIRFFLLDAESANYDLMKCKAFSTDRTPKNLTMLQYIPEECQSKSVFITLLEVYTKYKSELFNPTINEHDVWDMIANEMQDKCNFNCDGIQCRNNIDELKRDYERVKNFSTVKQGVIEFLNAAEEAFGTSEILGKRSSKKISNQKRKRRLEVLKAYNMYKEELLLPHVNKKNVWEKMVETVRKKYSLSKGDYGLKHFQSQMNSLMLEFKRKKNLKSCVTSPDETMFLKEAQLAFQHHSEFSVTPIKQVSSSKVSQKFIAKQERYFAELKVYNMYKKELSLRDGSKTSVWKKIAETVRKKRSLSKGDYGLSHFHSQILSFKCEYDRKKNLKFIQSHVTSLSDDMFLKEAQLAFEDPEFTDHLEQVKHLAIGINPDRV